LVRAKFGHCLTGRINTLEIQTLFHGNSKDQDQIQKTFHWYGVSPATEGPPSPWLPILGDKIISPDAPVTQGRLRSLEARILTASLLTMALAIPWVVEGCQVVTRDATSSTLVGATSLSLFIGNNRARKPLIAPNRFMT